MTRLYHQLIRWAFTRFYREFAWTYDTVAALVSGGQWRLWTLAALPYLEGRVLELGCGTGHVQLAAAGSARDLTGLDLSPQMLAITQAKLEHVGKQPRLIRASAGAIPLADASFDTLVATFPSEYIIAPATLAEARRVLRPGGQLVIILAAQFHGPSMYQRLVDMLYRVTLQRSIIAPTTPAAPRSIVGQRYGEAGFDVREEWAPVGVGSIDLHLIIAKR